MHEAWCEHKRAEGWTYGPDKDPDAKTHPCLVPYDQLPVEQRVKDAVFHAIVGALR
ncbi:RyR domain-containing protein [Nonomuraea thailandensis]